MQRREFLRRAGVGTAALAASLPTLGLKTQPNISASENAAKATSDEKPNILWLVSEDNDCFLGCYGDKLARTPTLDQLAREGVLFENCFAWPVCAPSRFTLITGMRDTQMTLEPSESTQAVTRAFTPLIMEEMVMTVVTPMTIPSTVSPERSLLVLNVSRAIFTDSRVCPFATKRRLS